jgi:glutamate synthase domain-containing protein 3
VTEIDAARLTTREVNGEIRRLMAEGEREIVIRNPAARHNLGVGILEPVKLVFDGSVGYYCAGLIDGPEVEIRGGAGWGVAENMMSGTVVVRQNAGNGAGATMRGGTLVIHGDAAARAGISMKGGTLIIAGDVGYMSGFMMQKGTMIVLGDAGEALGDSLYEGRIFVAGRIAVPGNDAVEEEVTAEDRAFLQHALAAHGLEDGRQFTKIVSGKQLYNFDKKEFARWREAL